MPLDQLDRRILEIVQDDADLSNVEIGDRIGLSPSPCLRRMRLLREAGIIRKRVALLEPEQIGVPLIVFVNISLEKQDEKSLKLFESRVVKLPEVVECYLVTGADLDYLLHVAMPDMKTYQRFLMDHITVIPGLARIRSSYALQKVKYSTALPLKFLPMGK